MDSEKEKELLEKYSFHIFLLVKVAKEALREGRAIIQDGILVVLPRDAPNSPNSSSERLDWPTRLKVRTE